MDVAGKQRNPDEVLYGRDKIGEPVHARGVPHGGDRAGKCARAGGVRHGYDYNRKRVYSDQDPIGQGEIGMRVLPDGARKFGGVSGQQVGFRNSEDGNAKRVGAKEVRTDGEDGNEKPVRAQVVRNDGDETGKKRVRAERLGDVGDEVNKKVIAWGVRNVDKIGKPGRDNGVGTGEDKNGTPAARADGVGIGKPDGARGLGNGEDEICIKPDTADGVGKGKDEISKRGWVEGVRYDDDENTGNRTHDAGIRADGSDTGKRVRVLNDGKHTGKRVHTDGTRISRSSTKLASPGLCIIVFTPPDHSRTMPPRRGDVKRKIFGGIAKVVYSFLPCRKFSAAAPTLYRPWL
uniref:Uncharacterized protein n=1 Tax=Nelumbo nucifera TaxID=4432 RepID=A0A822Z4S7_NELNU|nr:TPA_asm: hypothetical protein HUJ06_014150 [Nelumbo nucifera]